MTAYITAKCVFRPITSAVIEVILDVELGGISRVHTSRVRRGQSLILISDLMRKLSVKTVDCKRPLQTVDNRTHLLWSSNRELTTFCDSDSPAYSEYLDLDVKVNTNLCWLSELFWSWRLPINRFITMERWWTKGTMMLKSCVADIGSPSLHVRQICIPIWSSFAWFDMSFSRTPIYLQNNRGSKDTSAYIRKINISNNFA